MFVRKLGDEDAAKVQQEMKMLSRLRHPGIVAFLEFALREENQESRIYLVQELCVETVEHGFYEK